jgi:3-hydroxyethyl bacteriochlorophyllide a dehydrogenase
VLGRLLARMTIALGAAAPTVWETHAQRKGGAVGYEVVSPDEDPRRDYHSICDASGDSNILDTPPRPPRARGGAIDLAGFYADRLNFAFPVASPRRGTHPRRR